jgi:hypothetical protein
MDLWKSTDVQIWKKAREAYLLRIEAFGDEELVALEQWRRNELHAAAMKRKPPHATHEELVKLTRWKMKRGEWRARNLMLVKGNESARVASLTADAIAAMPDPRKPIALIAELDGVGPATASSLVSALRPEVYPFFDEVVAKQLPGIEKVAFTIPFYLRYAEALRSRATALGKGWTADAVAEALFAVAPESL